MNSVVRIVIPVAIACSVLATGSGLSVDRVEATGGHPAHVKGVAVSVWDPFPKRSTERLALQRVVQGWERATGNTVILGGYAADNYLKMCSASALGRGPDLVAVQDVQLAQLIACHAIQTVPASVWPASERKQYVKAAVLATELNGLNWAMPWAMTTYGLYYNRALVSARFFETGKLSWSNLIREATKLTYPKAHQLGLAWDIANFYLDYAFLSGSDGYVFRLTRKGFDPTALGVDSSSSIAGLQFVKDLTTAGKYKIVPSAMNGTQALTLFVKNKLAMCITGPWDQDSFRAYRVRFGFAPLPAMGAHPSRPFANVQVVAVNSRSKHASQAFSLMQYVTTHMQLPEHSSVQLPVIKAYLASPVVQSDLVQRMLARAVLDADPVPNVPAMNDVWAPMNTALADIVKGKTSPADAAHRAADIIKTNIRNSEAR